MSLYKTSRDEFVTIPGIDSMFTRRGVEIIDEVLCVGYCWTCRHYSSNPGCGISESILSAPYKHWNLLLLLTREMENKNIA